MIVAQDMDNERSFTVIMSDSELARLRKVGERIGGDDEDTIRYALNEAVAPD